MDTEKAVVAKKATAAKRAKLMPKQYFVTVRPGQVIWFSWL